MLPTGLVVELSPAAPHLHPTWPAQVARGLLHERLWLTRETRKRRDALGMREWPPP